MPDVEDTSADVSHDKSILLDTSVGLLQEGYAWVTKVPAGFGPGDTPNTPTASRLVLYEDGRELGPSHAQHETIRQIGGGAYSHWHNTLYFSTSDRSDPRTNRRNYRLALVSLRLVVIALDGADPQTLRRYIADGRLPMIARILERSREAEVQSEGELFINSFWPCFASGLSVGSHGVHAFRPLRSGTMQLVERTHYPVRTPFWEMAARAGIRTCVLDGPYYGPPAAESGLEKLTYGGMGAASAGAATRLPGPEPYPALASPPRSSPLPHRRGDCSHRSGFGRYGDAPMCWRSQARGHCQRSDPDDQSGTACCPLSRVAHGRAPVAAQRDARSPLLRCCVGECARHADPTGVRSR